MSLLDEVDPAKNPNLEFVFHDLAKSIVRWRDEGKTVLVHCVQAERRTPAVGAAYLAERKGLPGKVALETVCAQLPSARVNPAFAEALGNVWPGGRATATRAGLL
jgi:protein-tyrosine phosphatase